MNFKTLALAAAAAVGFSGAASAATLSVVGVDTVAFGTGNFKADCSNGGPTTCYNPHGTAPANPGTLTTFFAPYVDPTSGIFISGSAPIRVTFLGKEAGATNAAFTMVGGSSVTTLSGVGSSFVADVAGPGLLSFFFEIISGVTGAPTGATAGSNGFTNNAGIAFSAVFNGGRSVYAFFDDSGADRNRDWDDMVVRIDVVPVPAAGLLLLGGLGAMAAMKRRRKAA